MSIRYSLALLLVFIPAFVVAEGTAKIGVIVPLSGPAASMGTSIESALRLVHPKSLALVFEDDQCEAKRALAAYHKLKAQGVRVFYAACSGSIMALAPFAKSDGNLILTGYAGSAAIRKTGPEVIRFNPDAVSIAEVIASDLKNRPARIAILFEEQDYASSLTDLLKEKLAGRVVATQSYRPQQASYQAELLSLRKKKPDAIVFVPVSDSTARVVLRQMADLGFSIPVIGEVNLCDYPFKPADFGLHGMCFAARFAGTAFDEFESSFRAETGRTSDYPFYDAITRDIGLVLEDRARMGKSFAPEDLKSQILAGVQGKVATYHFDTNGEATEAGQYLIKVVY